MVPGRSKIIFVQVCFWHRHSKSALARLPKSRIDFCETKLESNRRRDPKNKRALIREGGSVLTIWESQIKGTDRLRENVIMVARSACQIVENTVSYWGEYPFGC